MSKSVRMSDLFRYFQLIEEDPLVGIKEYKVENFKGFLEWILEEANGNITRRATIELKWAALRMYYSKLTGKTIDEETSKEIRHVNYTFL